jgi:small-conductance mechanosensitive channel
MAIRSDLSVAVVREFAAAGIRIPFPQRDLHLRSIDPALRQPPPPTAPDDSA